MVPARAPVNTSPAMKLASFAVIAAVLSGPAGCSSKPPDNQPEARKDPPAAAVAPVPPPPTAALPAPPPTPAPAANGAIPADFPPACRDYAALIDKLKACDKLGGARDGLMVGYNGLRSSWASVPADQRAGVAVQCKTQADSLRNAAAATCGW